jgi:hypothetical protein
MALWISKWMVMANDGNMQPVVYFLLVQPVEDIFDPQYHSCWKRIGVGHTQNLLTKEVLGEGPFLNCESQTIYLE